jgi:UDP-N-acetylglucosamine 2-epimerase (non-hydrolysing)
MRVDIVAGARPNFMKVAPIVRVLDAHRVAGGPLRYRLVHTGQHSDPRMSGSFFEQLGIPAPDENLAAAGGTQAEQTSAIMTRYERLLADAPPALCLVVGDVTSTLAAAVTARKAGVMVAHVEAGIRSGDWTMPEEVNRVVTDAVSSHFFTTSVLAGENLRRAGVADDSIHFVGNTMIDTLVWSLDRLVPPGFWHEMSLRPGEYVVLTLHRPANVDDPERLRACLEAVVAAARHLPVIFAVHPRTGKSLEGLQPLPDTLRLVEPQPYLQFIHLVRHACAVVTDSGGITEETTVLGVPCMTLRDSTERPETVALGTSELIGTDPSALAPAFERLFAGRWKKGRIPEKWDGRAAERIVAVLEGLAGAGV